MSKASDKNRKRKKNGAHRYQVVEQDVTVTDNNSSPAVMSLYRLETDIQKLHSKWSDVESSLHDRDATIARLNSELELRHANLQSLHDELDKVEAEREQVDAQTEALKTEIRELEECVRNKDKSLAASTADLEVINQQIAKLSIERKDALSRAEAMQINLKEQQQLIADSNLQIQVREKDSAQLRVTIQELEAYIDRRKVDWEKLNRDLDDYRNSLVGMQKEANAHGREIKKREKEKELLAKRIFELEQQVAELEGRCAERKSRNDELQALCDKRGQDMELIASELANERAKSGQLNDKIVTQEAHIDSLISDLSKKHERVTQLEILVLETNNTVIEKEAELAALSASQDERLESSLSEERIKTDTVRAELEKHKATIASLEAALEDEREQAGKLHADYQRTHAELGELHNDYASLDQEHTEQKERFTKLLSKYEENQQESIQLWDELKQSRETLDEARVRLTDSEEKIFALEEDTRVFGAEIGTMRDELIGKNQQIAKLETELSVRKETITLLDKNVQRINAIDSHVQTLDKEITLKNGQSRQMNTAAMGDVVRMIIARNGGQTIKFPLTKESMTIGRSMDNDIQFRQKFVSRNHARIVCGESGALIEDLGSKNGIFVNNEPVESLELHNGDRVDIGEVQFEYIDLAEQDSAIPNA